MLQNLFLKEIEVTRSELMKQEHKVQSLKYYISEFQQQAFAWRTPITDMLNLDENKFDYKKN